MEIIKRLSEAVIEGLIGVESMYKDLLLNMFIVLIPLIFIKFVLKRKNKYLPIVTYFLFFIPTMLTMHFPVKMYSTTFDLRSIPMILGSFYGGPLTASMLFISLLIYRSFLDDINVFSYACALLPTYLIIITILKGYKNIRPAIRVWIVAVVVFFMRFSVVGIYYVLIGSSPLSQTLIPSLPFFFMQSILAGFCCYTIESIIHNHKLTEEMIKTEKMKIVSDMAASVAHEVRNPLTAVRGFIQLLGNQDVSEEKRKSYRDLCLEELDRAQLIISDYLALAKPEQEKLENINIDKEFTYISSLLSSYANLQNVQININVPESITIIGNQSKFRQAIINIAKNAIEAMPDGGLLDFEVTTRNNKVEIIIHDTGTGMTADQVRRLGTPYYSTKEKGTGLGTMVTFNIIRQMGGKVDVHSDVGNGTTFTVSLPL